MSHRIYIYTTKSQSKKSIAIEDGEVFVVRLKVGETMLTADERIAQQDGTSNSETLIKIFEKPAPEHITDKVLHKALQRKGYVKSRDDRSREWFDFPDCINADQAKKVVIETLNGLVSGKEALCDWPAFNYQQAIVDWASEQFETKDDILINAIMRAGKCFITYEIARKVKAKTVLVVTAKVGVNDSWSALLPNGEESHVYYADWKYHDYKKIKSLHLDGEVNVVFASLQFINKHFGKSNKLLNSILDQHWDLVAFDEQHYATETDNTQRLWDALDFTRKVELSGTPYKTVLSGRYEQDSIYNFDYVNEQTLRKQALKTPDSDVARAFKYRADINYAMVNVPDKVKAYLGEDGFTFPKLFATTHKQFNNVMAVNEFLTFAVQTYKKPPNKFKAIADKVSRHALWVLPNDVAAIGALETMLKAHPFFGKRKIINASGKGVKDIQSVKDAIHRSDAKDGAGTITLTCGRFLEGTSVPEWWSVHQMNNDKSAADYFQGSFRCKTPWSAGDKDRVIVFDYAPERFVSVVYQHCEQVSIVDKRPVEAIISEWLDVSEVYDYDGNQWNVLTGAEISTRFLSDINNYMDRVGQAVDKSGIDESIIDLLDSKSKDSNQTSATSELNSNGIDTGKNKNRLGKGANGATDDNEEDPVEETARRIRYALKQVFKLIDVAWADDINIGNMQDITKCSDAKLVEDITGLTPVEWSMISPAINQTSINRAIGQYNDFQ